jgi:excinuclease ABC subunit B
MQYRRNDLNLVRGTFRVRGDTLEFVAVDEELVHRIEFFGDEIEAINVVNQLTGEYVESKDELKIFPAKHYITPDEKLRARSSRSRKSSRSGCEFFRGDGKLLEAQRLEQRTRYDLDMLREVGYCNGVENYSRRCRDASPARRRGACSTSSRPKTGCCSSTSRTSRSRRCTGCTAATARASSSW